MYLQIAGIIILEVEMCILDRIESSVFWSWTMVAGRPAKNQSVIDGNPL